MRIKLQMERILSQSTKHRQTQQLLQIPHQSTPHRATTLRRKSILLQVELTVPSPSIQRRLAIQQLLTALRRTKPTRATRRRLLIQRQLIVPLRLIKHQTPTQLQRIILRQSSRQTQPRPTRLQRILPRLIQPSPRTKHQ